MVLPAEPTSLHRSPPAVPPTHHTSVVPVWSQPCNHTQTSGSASGSPRCVHERAGTSGRHQLSWFPGKSVRASSVVLPACWDAREWGCMRSRCGVCMDFIPSCPREQFWDHTWRVCNPSGRIHGQAQTSQSTAIYFVFRGGSWQLRSLPAPLLAATATATTPGTFPSAAVPAPSAREEAREAYDHKDREKAEKSSRLGSGHLCWDALAGKPQGVCDVGEAPGAQAHEKVPRAADQPGAESSGAQILAVPQSCPLLGQVVSG